MTDGDVSLHNTTTKTELLVVDPSHEVSDILAHVLDVCSWNLRCVPDNHSALILVQERRFDVILTSEKTSGSEDIDLLRHIRSIHPHTRMIILTDRGTPEHVAAAMREHAFSYFTWPFSPNALAEMLRLAMTTASWDDGIELLSATPSWIHLFARCDVETADRLVHFLQEVGETLSPSEKQDVSAAFREMLMNAIEHGGHFNPSEYVEISYLRSRRAVSCRIRDPGQGFSLNEIPHAAISNPPDDPFFHLNHRDSQGLRAGGYGVLLARELVDELIYGEKGNEVVLVKYIVPAPDPAIALS
jgi:anti-sigma regulatory factor (Ser/Thr protein kinase)/CheY-like chemotaxis protein